MSRYRWRGLTEAGLRNVELLRGAFRHVPLPDNSVDAVVACSAFGPDEARGGRCAWTNSCASLVPVGAL